MENHFAPSRFKILDGTLYRRDDTPFSYDARVHVLGVHVEAVAVPRYGWREVDTVSESVQADAFMAAGHIWKDGGWVPTPSSDSDLLDKAAANRERSARRARTKVRRLCKAKGLTTLLTLTYRENMTDRERLVRDFDVFIKRLRRVVPDFQYVCVFERQKRGAWHAHIAVARVLSHYVHKGALVRSYDLLRSMWRAVVGTDNGNIDVARSRRVARSSAKLAAYVSKYVTKTFGDQGEGGDSYRASGKALPQPVVVRLHTASLSEAAMGLIDLLSADISKSGDFHHALLDGGGYFVSLSP
jgi:hypothetical protein